MSRILAALFFTFCFSSTTLAQNEDPNGPCKDDIQKFCQGIKKGKGRIMKCLKKHEAELSDACKGKAKDLKQRLSEAKDACKDDIANFCKDIPSGEGRIMACLKANSFRISDGCKSTLMGK